MTSSPIRRSSTRRSPLGVASLVPFSRQRLLDEGDEGDECEEDDDEEDDDEDEDEDDEDPA
jgi:hypothetical protein